MSVINNWGFAIRLGLKNPYWTVNATIAMQCCFRIAAKGKQLGQNLWYAN